MRYEWDAAKRDSNLVKHGVDFVRAQLLFDGRPVITASSRRAEEDRFATTGMIGDRCYTVVWTGRGDVIRLISARRARREEERSHRELYGSGD